MHVLNIFEWYSPFAMQLSNQHKTHPKNQKLISLLSFFPKQNMCLLLLANRTVIRSQHSGIIAWVADDTGCVLQFWSRFDCLVHFHSICNSVKVSRRDEVHSQVRYYHYPENGLLSTLFFGRIKADYLREREREQFQKERESSLMRKKWK